MKKFLIKVSAFALIIIAIDIIVGVVFPIIAKHAKGGDTQRMNTIAFQLKDEILIFGSSRAAHHYDPAILADSLHLRCYNCGRDGNGIIFSYGQYQLIRSRYTPKTRVSDKIIV